MTDTRHQPKRMGAGVSDKEAGAGSTAGAACEAAGATDAGGLPDFSTRAASGCFFGAGCSSSASVSRALLIRVSWGYRLMNSWNVASAAAVSPRSSLYIWPIVNSASTRYLLPGYSRRKNSYSLMAARSLSRPAELASHGGEQFGNRNDAGIRLGRSAWRAVIDLAIRGDHLQYSGRVRSASGRPFTPRATVQLFQIPAARLAWDCASLRKRRYKGGRQAKAERRSYIGGRGAKRRLSDGARMGT